MTGIPASWQDGQGAPEQAISGAGGGAGEYWVIGAAPAAQPPPSGGPPCSPLNLGGCISGAVTGFLRAVVADALNPMLRLLSSRLAIASARPDHPGCPRRAGHAEPVAAARLVELWTGSWAIVLAEGGVRVR